jgi:transposase-like protein
MRERMVRRYSECFKRQVIADLESGRFASIAEAREQYGITGADTVPRWLRRYGRNDLQAKVVRVEKPDEADRLRQLKREVERLQKALGQTQAQNVLNAEYLKLACEKLGEDMESFKKKCDGRRCTGPTEPQR